MSRRYCLISPCRNEGRYVRRTIESILRQNERPGLWVIVDDGSHDETPNILAQYARNISWIQVVRRPDRGARKVGGGVIEAFQEGLARVDLNQFDYLCKLDVDLELPATYFAQLIDRMEADRTIGTCSGKAYYPAAGNTRESFDGPLIAECIGDDVSVGAAKFYRVECFRQIGGFVPTVMWDGIDCHRCRMLGWRALSWDDPGLRFLHLRPMGSSERGVLTGRARHGSGQYRMGTAWWYLLASALFRMRHRPCVLGGLAMIYGYLRSACRGEKRYDDPAFRTFLRRYQWLCLTRGKQQALERVANRTGPETCPPDRLGRQVASALEGAACFDVQDG